MSAPIPEKGIGALAADRRLSTNLTYISACAWKESDEDKSYLEAEIAVLPPSCRVLDCPITADSAMGEGMATGRLQDLADADKYTLVQGHDKKQVQSVNVGATGLTLNLPGDALGNLAGNFLGVGASPAKTAFFWEDVRAIHCSKIETVSDHPGTSYYCGVVASSLKKPFMVQCAGAQTMEHLVSAMEFFIQKAQGGHGVPIGGVPYINQGVRLDDQGRPAVMWDNSPVAEAFGHATGSEPFGFRIWGVDYDADAQLNREKLEAGLQGLAPGKHNLYVVTPQDWDKARRSEDFQSDETPNPERRLYQLLVP